MSEPASKRLKFIGCEIIYREACLLAARSPHCVDLQFLRKGLHGLDTPDMLARLQAAVMFDEMVTHRFLSEDHRAQETEFASGVVVRIDHDRRTFRITGVEGIPEKELEVGDLGEGRR